MLKILWFVSIEKFHHNLCKQYSYLFNFLVTVTYRVVQVSNTNTITPDSESSSLPQIISANPTLTSNQQIQTVFTNPLNGMHLLSQLSTFWIFFLRSNTVLYRQSIWMNRQWFCRICNGINTVILCLRSKGQLYVIGSADEVYPKANSHKPIAPRTASVVENVGSPVISVSTGPWFLKFFSSLGKLVWDHLIKSQKRISSL